MDGSSLLHLAVTGDASSFTVAANFLLEAGANVDAVDAKGNTPLHLVAALGLGRDLGDRHDVVVRIVERAHLDVVNSAGKTSRQVAEGSYRGEGIAGVLKEQVSPLTCLAAKVLKGRAAEEEEYKDQLPVPLVAFMRLH
jgi:hypothetical protein